MIKFQIINEGRAPNVMFIEALCCKSVCQFRMLGYFLKFAENYGELQSEGPSSSWMFSESINSRFHGNSNFFLV